MFSFLRVWKNARCRPAAAPVKSKRLGPAQFRPQLEPLEDRQAPATHVWSGAVSPEWSDPRNWSSGGSPYADPIHQAVVIFPATGVTNFTSVHNLNGTAELYSIVLQGSGYTLAGDAITIRWEIDDQSRGGNYKIDFEILGFRGDFEEQRINVLRGGTLNVTSPISGRTYALRKEGAGTLLLPKSNNLTAGFTLEFGRVVIGTNTSLGTGAIAIQGGTLASSTAVALSNPLSVEQPSSANPNFDAVNDMRFTGNVSIGHERNLKVTGSRFIRFDGVLSGPGGVVMNGDGELTLTGDNTFEGPTTVLKGFVSVEHNNALGTGRLYLEGGGLRRGVGGGSNIILRNAFEVPTARKGRIENDTMELTLAGPGQINGELEVSGGTIDVIFPEPPPIVIRISGPLFGPGGVTMVDEPLPLGNYLLILGRGPANTYQSVTNVFKGTLLLDKAPGLDAIPGALVVERSGVVRLAAANQIADVAAVTVNGSGLIEMNDFDDAWGSLEGSGQVNTADPPTLTVGGNNLSTTFDGVINGPGTVVKVGTGTWTLNGTNTYSGGTVVNEGALLVNGAVGEVTVNAGGTLGGTGVTGPVTLSGGAALSPGGAATGVQRVQDLAFASGSSFVVQINGLTPGTDYDQLDVTGGVSLNGAALSASLGFSPAAGDTFVVVKNDGSDPADGTFAGLPQGAALQIGGLAFHIYYDRGEGGNDVVLVRNVPPAIARPGGQTAFQNLDLSINSIAVADPEDAILTVTLEVSHGTLTLGTVASLTVGGNGTSTVRLSGSQAALNAALAGLIYRPTQNYSGVETLTITASDGLDVSSGTVAIQVKSSAEQAADLQAQVNALRAAGVLDQGKANSLIVKLNLHNNNGDVGRVQSFLNEVEAFVQAGILSPAQANSLLGAGNVLLTGLKRR